MMNIIEQYQLAAQLLGMDCDDIGKYGGVIEEIHALYVSVPVKGGASLIVGEDGEVLFADSSIGYSRHLKAFKEGKRTPREAFAISEGNNSGC